MELHTKQTQAATVGHASSAKQRQVATHATSRQTNTGALALWDCVHTDVWAEGSDVMT